MNKPEDLIGTEWKCPWIGCDYTCKITKDGVKHVVKGDGDRTFHMVNMSLEEIFKLRQWEIEHRKMMLYGKHKQNNTDSK